MAGNSQKVELSPETLQDAFQTFNQLSDQLANSYRALEERVTHLNEELVSTNDARIHELTQKERLANRLSTLLQALPGGVVVLDETGQIQEFNQAAVDLLGEPLEGVVWADVISRAFAPKTDNGHEVSLVDGRLVNISTCPMVNGPGQILLITDVTEMHELQDRFNQHKRLVAMGEMAASLAHQIRTPLASAMLYSSNLKRKDLSLADHDRFCEKIHSRLAHLEHIVNDMLLYARSSNTRAEDTFTLDSLMVELEHNLDAQLLQTNCELTCTDETNGLKFVANRQMLLSALINLAVNAIQSMGQYGRLSVLVRKADEHNIEIYVCDNGPGISREKLDHIFDPFFTTRNEGTGLGLAVVRAVVHAHKGEIIVNSEADTGTTFILRLPILSTSSGSGFDLNGNNTLSCIVG